MQYSTFCALWGSWPAPGATGHNMGAGLIKPYTAGSPVQMLGFPTFDEGGNSWMRCNLQNWQTSLWRKFAGIWQEICGNIAETCGLEIFTNTSAWPGCFWSPILRRNLRICSIPVNLRSTSTSPGTPHHNICHFWVNIAFLVQHGTFFSCFEISHLVYWIGWSRKDHYHQLEWCDPIT